MAKAIQTERAFLQRLRKRAGLAEGAVRVGIGDDAAVLRPPAGSEVVVTTDFSLEGKHFRRDWHPGRSAGHRALARGLSDLAAMGATPLAAFLSLALPKGIFASARGRIFVDDFLDGLLDLAAGFNLPLAGGDLAAAPGSQILADIVLLGSAPRGKALLRNGAQVGDGLYVTGRLGAAASELAQLAKSPRTFATAKDDGTHPHLFPAPRIAVGEFLREKKLATSAIDLSDGLSVDLAHLCEESGVGALVEAADLPRGGSLEQALHGGEDYELIFTSRRKMPAAIAGLPITRIGTITARRGGVRIRTGKKTAPLQPKGWEHTF